MKTVMPQSYFYIFFLKLFSLHIPSFPSLCLIPISFFLQFFSVCRNLHIWMDKRVGLMANIESKLRDMKEWKGEQSWIEKITFFQSYDKINVWKFYVSSLLLSLFFLQKLNFLNFIQTNPLSGKVSLTRNRVKWILSLYN